MIKSHIKSGAYKKQSERLKKYPIAKYCKSPSRPQSRIYKNIKQLFYFTEVFLNYPIKKQDGGYYYLDIAVPSINLNIEYDSNYWHQYSQEKDIKRDEYLKYLGWEVIRIKGDLR